MKLFLATTLFLTLISCCANAQEDGGVTNGRCIELEHIDGTTKNICDKSEKPYLILEFFSARCGYCRRNVPLFKTLEDATKDHASSRLISVNPLAEAADFARTYDIQTDVAVDALNAASRSFGVTGVPTIFVLDRDNQIIFKHVGVLDNAAIEDVKRLINRPRESQP